MKLRGALKVFLVAVVITYPVFVFLALVVFNLPISIVSLGMLVIALAYFGFVSGDGKRNWTAIILGVMALVVLVTKSELVLKFYPVFMTLVFLIMFGVPLLKGKPIITRFAMMMDPAIATHPARGVLERCCKGLNIAWCIHILMSVGINIAICFGSTLEVWTLYNTVISYAVTGLLVSAQFLVIRLANRKADKVIAFNGMAPDARPRDYIVGYYGSQYTYGSPENRTWGDLFDAVSSAGSGDSVEGTGAPADLWEFTIALLSTEDSSAGPADGTMEYTSYITSLWEKRGYGESAFTFLPCPGNRRVIDLVRGVCAR